jgi:hypothetical protein
MWGDLVLALVKRSGDIEEFKELEPAAALKAGHGWCRVKRKGSEAIERTFSVEEATKANLWSKAGPWQQYPGRMLQMRARSFALRDECPDILNGIDIREEVQDYEVVGETPDGRTIVQPRRLSERKALEAGESSIVEDFLKGHSAPAAVAQGATGSGTAASATASGSNEVTVKVEGVEEKTYQRKDKAGKPTGEQGTFYVVLAGGQRYATFKPEEADEATVAQRSGVSVLIAYEETPRGRVIRKIAPVADEVADLPADAP